MNTEQTDELERRASVYGALADPARLQIVDILSASDASPSELARELAMPSNLLAHHLNVLEAKRLVVRHRSEGDQRRTYIHLVHDALANLAPVGIYRARRPVDLGRHAPRGADRPSGVGSREASPTAIATHASATDR